MVGPIQPAHGVSGHEAAGGVAMAPAHRFATIAAIAFLTLVDLFAAQAILPTLTAAYRVTPAAMGVAVNASTLGMAAAGLGVAVLGGRLDRRAGIVASLALLAGPTALLAVAPNLTVFTLLRVAQGLCMATAFSLTLAHLGEAQEAAATGVAAYITGNVASNLIGRLMSAAVADHFDLATTFLVFAALNVAGALLAAVAIPRRTAPAAARIDRPWAPVVRHLRTPRLLAAFAIGFCILFAFIGTFTYINFVLVRPPLSLGMMAIGFVYFVFAPSIVTTPFAGAVARRFGTRQAFVAGMAIALAGLPLTLAPSLASVLAGLALVAVGTFMAQAVVTGFVSQAAPVDRSAASGLYLASYFGGGLVGSAVVGRLYEAAGWPACVAGIGTALALGLLLGFALSTPPVLLHRTNR